MQRHNKHTLEGIIQETAKEKQALYNEYLSQLMPSENSINSVFALPSWQSSQFDINTILTRTRNRSSIRLAKEYFKDHMSTLITKATHEGCPALATLLEQIKINLLTYNLDDRFFCEGIQFGEKLSAEDNQKCDAASAINHINGIATMTVRNFFDHYKNNSRKLDYMYKALYSHINPNELDNVKVRYKNAILFLKDLIAMRDFARESNHTELVDKYNTWIQKVKNYSKDTIVFNDGRAVSDEQLNDKEKWSTHQQTSLYDGKKTCKYKRFYEAYETRFRSIVQEEISKDKNTIQEYLLLQTQTTTTSITPVIFTDPFGEIEFLEPTAELTAEPTVNANEIETTFFEHDLQGGIDDNAEDMALYQQYLQGIASSVTQPTTSEVSTTDLQFETENSERQTKRLRSSEPQHTLSSPDMHPADSLEMHYVQTSLPLRTTTKLKVHNQGSVLFYNDLFAIFNLALKANHSGLISKYNQWLDEVENYNKNTRVFADGRVVSQEQLQDAGNWTKYGNGLLYKGEQTWIYKSFCERYEVTHREYIKREIAQDMLVVQHIPNPSSAFFGYGLEGGTDISSSADLSTHIPSPTPILKVNMAGAHMLYQDLSEMRDFAQAANHIELTQKYNSWLEEIKNYTLTTRVSVNGKALSDIEIEKMRGAFGYGNRPLLYKSFCDRYKRSYRNNILSEINKDKAIIQNSLQSQPVASLPTRHTAFFANTNDDLFGFTDDLFPRFNNGTN